MIRVTSYLSAILLIAFLAVPFPSLASEDDQHWIYVAKPGDNLWDITKKYLTGIKYWRPLQRMNNIARPRQIPPGTHIRIPVSWSRVKLAGVKISAIQGDVKVISGDQGAETDATTGQVLKQGDKVLTPQEANALLVFADGTELLLTSGSSLRLNTLKAYGDGEVADSHVYLEQGQTENRANPDKIPSTRFNITTPSAVMAIRGTNFRVGSSEEGSHVEVTEGIVQVSNETDEAILKSGFGLVTRAGQQLDEPVPLLPAPDLSSMPGIIETTSVKIDIPSSEDADAYRVQIAEQTRDDVFVHDMTYKPGQVYPDLTPLPDGEYIVLVRAIDTAGIQGHNADANFILNARPVPPAIIAPVADARLVEKRPEFRWARPDGSSKYRLQVFQDDQSNKSLLDQEGITTESYRLGSDLLPGAYKWRLQAYDQAGLPGPFGHFQAFRVLPEAPEMTEPQLDENSLTLQWRSAGAGYQYHFQLSRKADFSELLADETLDASRYVLENPEQGNYYMRVGSVDTEGFQGPYSPTQSFNVPGPDRSWLTIVIFAAALLFAL